MRVCVCAIKPQPHLLLHPAHELLGLVVLRRHDVGHAQVGKHDGGHRRDVISRLLDYGLVVTDRLLELGLLREGEKRGAGRVRAGVSDNMCSGESEPSSRCAAPIPLPPPPQPAAGKRASTGDVPTIPSSPPAPPHLQEEDMRHIELPRLVLGAKLSRLPKDLFHHREVLAVPIDLGLSHQDGDVPACGGWGVSWAQATGQDQHSADAPVKDGQGQLAPLVSTHVSTEARSLTSQAKAVYHPCRASPHCRRRGGCHLSRASS